jgi:hypothetical protein
MSIVLIALMHRRDIPQVIHGYDQQQNQPGSDDNGAVKIFLPLVGVVVGGLSRCGSSLAPRWLRFNGRKTFVSANFLRCDSLVQIKPVAVRIHISWLLCLVKGCGVVSISKFGKRRFLKMRNIGRHSLGSTGESAWFGNQMHHAFAAHGKTTGCPQLAFGIRRTRLTFEDLKPGPGSLGDFSWDVLLK